LSNPAKQRRVVITGIGATTPIGHDVHSSVSAIREGRHGIRPMPEWDHISDLQGRLGSTVEGLDLKKHYPRKRRRTMGPVALFAVHATEQAVAQAGLDLDSLKSERVGVSFGSTSGSGSETEKFSMPVVTDHSMKGLESNAYFRLMTHTCAVNVAQFFGVKGRIASTCTACTSGSQGIGTAYELIQGGIQDVMLCGGAEEMHYMSAVTFDLLMATSTKYNDRPDMSPRPFDADRDGLVIGEGAGAFVLESLEHAEARGATILAELCGYASNCDGAHLTAPREEGMQRVMQLALEDAGIGADMIDYVCGHGTATEIGDIAESRATAAVFGRKVPFASLKGYVGHTLGACGAMEGAWCVAMLQGGFLLPGRNLETVDPRCGELDYVTEVRETAPRFVMNNNFAFGGINTSMVLGPAPSR
tara:strand:+ start:8401 stop:9651 length:1251 start_codon:yes stop_codon:yes gene_type:complete